MKPLQIGITGGIGAGKSLICKILTILNIPVYDSDEESKKILDSDPGVIKSVIALFGSEAYQDNGNANRAFISRIVFNDTAKLQQLNALLHPAVKRHYMDWISTFASCPILAKEAAILFESGSDKDLDYVIAVVAPEAIRIQRVVKRDGKKPAEVNQIIKQQLSQDEVVKRSDFVIVNDDEHLVVPQVLEIVRKINMSSN